MLETHFDMGSLADLAKAKTEAVVVETNILTVTDHLNRVRAYIFDEYQNMAETRRYTLGFTRREFIQYLNDLIFIRVGYVRNDHSGLYNRVKYDAYHPHLINSIISTIGKGYIELYGIEIIPAAINSVAIDETYQPTKDERTLSQIEDFIGEMSLKLRSFKRNAGVSMAEQLPSDKSGDALVMSFQLIQSEVKAPDTQRSHTQAFLALVAGISLPTTYLTPRVKYISRDSVELLLRNVTRFEFANKDS